MFEATPDMLDAARQELRCRQPAAALRNVARQFQLTRTALAWLAADVYVNIMTPEVQAIWHWDLAESGKGHTDAELDELLSHLVLRPS